MPVLSAIPIPRLSRQAFGDATYGVMKVLFEIHNEFGALCDEKIYKRELANRLSSVRLEMPIDVTFGTFAKRYFVDAVTQDGGVFELKAVEDLTARHRAQLLNYLFLLDVEHGKLVNMRHGKVQHVFVNAAASAADRREFSVDRLDWATTAPGADQLEGVLLPLVKDLGTGLDSMIYDDAIWHLLEGECKSAQEFEVTSVDGRLLGFQQFRLCAAKAAYRVTTFPVVAASYADHLRRLLRHTPLKVIQWLNIARRQVTLTSIRST